MKFYYVIYSSNLRMLVSHVGDAPIIDSTTKGRYVKQLIISSTERVYTMGISD